MKRFKEKLMITAVMAIFIIIAQAVNAQPAKKNCELINDRYDLKQSRADLADDQADLQRLSRLIFRLENAHYYNDVRAMRSINSLIENEINDDIRETSIQVEQARREIIRSAREFGLNIRNWDDDNELLAVVTKGKKNKVIVVKQKHNNRADFRDDRRDLFDDIRDFRQARQILNQKKQVAFELDALDHTRVKSKNRVFDLRNERISLLNNYADLSREEIVMGKQEINEDRRELREDRFENGNAFKRIRTFGSVGF